MPRLFDMRPIAPQTRNAPPHSHRGAIGTPGPAQPRAARMSTPDPVGCRAPRTHDGRRHGLDPSPGVALAPTATPASGREAMAIGLRVERLLNAVDPPEAQRLVYRVDIADRGQLRRLLAERDPNLIGPIVVGPKPLSEFLRRQEELDVARGKHRHLRVCLGDVAGGEVRRAKPTKWRGLLGTDRLGNGAAPPEATTFTGVDHTWWLSAVGRNRLIEVIGVGYG